MGKTSAIRQVALATKSLLIEQAGADSFTDSDMVGVEIPSEKRMSGSIGNVLTHARERWENLSCFFWINSCATTPAHKRRSCDSCFPSPQRSRASWVSRATARSAPRPLRFGAMNGRPPSQSQSCWLPIPGAMPPTLPWFGAHRAGHGGFREQRGETLLVADTRRN